MKEIIKYLRDQKNELHDILMSPKRILDTCDTNQIRAGWKGFNNQKEHLQKKHDEVVIALSILQSYKPN